MKHYLVFCAFVLWLGLGPAIGQEAKPTDNNSLTLSDNLSTNLTEQANAKYVLVIGDVIELRVFQEDELNLRARIDKDKTVSHSLLGTINLAGLTVAEAQTKVKDLLEKDYLYNPQVALTVVDYAAKKFSVLGQVVRPGFYEIPPNSKITLLQALSMAGGFTRIAKQTAIVVKRVVAGKEKTWTLDAKKMQNGDVSLFTIEPEDSISVPETKF